MSEDLGFEHRHDDPRTEGIAPDGSGLTRRTFLRRMAGAAALGWSVQGRPPSLAAVGPGTPEGRPPHCWLPLIRAHLQMIIDKGTDAYGPVKTPMWMASLDTRTGRYPDSPVARVPQRVYRDIAAPHGSTIYWDQPQLAAAHAMGGFVDDPTLVKASEAYVASFLERCVCEKTGLFEWGNHIYYDAFQDKVTRFQQGWHETRPISPTWELFWRCSPEITERCIRAIGARHILDSETGKFDRHDSVEHPERNKLAFLESGGIIVESLCWLNRRRPDRKLGELALRVARFSFDHRSRKTGLIENTPTTTRWDKWVSTTEVGLWAGPLLRAADISGNDEYIHMAREGVAAFLKYGWDERAERYYGRLNVKDGTPSLDAPPDERCPSKSNRPRNYSSPWNAFFPSHDYPLALAEVCVELAERTGEARFREGIERWAHVLRNEPCPPKTGAGQGAYAEVYGRAIHFLTHAAEVTGQRHYLQQAHELANEAYEEFWHGREPSDAGPVGMFRSHAGEDRYDAVDGVGYLLLALIYLETGRRADYLGFGF